MNLGKTLRDYRKSFGYTQEEAAKKAKITQTYLSQLENNQREAAPKTIESLAKVYKTMVPAIYFMSIEEKDIAPAKIPMFRILMPSIKELLSSYKL